jgi:two-component sensor histidine kinase
MGGPEVQRPTRQGFGARVIEGMASQYRGKAHFDWRVEGLVCEIALKA